MQNDHGMIKPSCNDSAVNLHACASLSSIRLNLGRNLQLKARAGPLPVHAYGPLLWLLKMQSCVLADRQQQLKQLLLQFFLVRLNVQGLQQLPLQPLSIQHCTLQQQRSGP